MSSYADLGWQVFEPEPSVVTWAAAALPHARRALSAPEMSHWYQCENTWFVGLEALQNDALGRVGDSGPLTGRVVDFIAGSCGGWPALHRAQVSAVFPGYPRPRVGENDAAFRYRKNRDAAHVDGIIGKGQAKRRFVEEPHAFVLGLPLNEAEAGAAPLVVWERSHHVMRRALQARLDATQGADLSTVDVTEAYQQARRECFETCRRVELHTPPGGAILLHRLALHGVAPWQSGASADSGRLIAYFRPPMAGGVAQWIGADAD